MKVRSYTRKGLKTDGIIVQVLSVIIGLWELLFFLDSGSVWRLILLACAVYMFILGAKCRKIARDSKNDIIYMNGWKVQ